MVLCKEYRIPMPLTVEEYRIAQLYMLSKKSRQESHGAGSGIEILMNEPYDNGPGPDGTGQYTRKVYHVGSHLPAWVKSLIPKSALSVEEEAWNAYPYTKTRFTCPFVEKFNIEVETFYFDDGGHQDNVFHLNSAELKQREVDLIDMVKDQLFGADYNEEEDPTLYISQKTGRGPLGEEWIKDYWDECKDHKTPLPNGKAIMCAYKLCKVEFRYWGMQTKIEKFIHDSALRKTMLRAHRQAWAWMDEWWGLSIENIRSIEKETQDLLAKKYGGGRDSEEEDEEEKKDREKEGMETPPLSTKEEHQLSNQSIINDRMNPQRDKRGMDDEDYGDKNSPRNKQKDWGPNSELMLNEGLKKRNSWSRSASRNTLSSHSQASWRMESIRRDSVSSESDDEFFDCQEDTYESSPALHKWSSLEILPNDEDGDSQVIKEGTINDSIFSPTYMSRVTSDKFQKHNFIGRSADASVPPSPSVSPSHQPSPCDTTVLLMVVHGGSVLESSGEVTNKKSDLTTFRGAFECVIRQHYPHLIGRVGIKLISAPSVCSASLSVIASLSPHGLDSTGSVSDCSSEDQVPVGALPILGTISKDYEESITKTVLSLNVAYHEFLNSEEGLGFCGQVCVVGDSVGGILCYDALCRGVDSHRGDLPSPGDEGDFGSKMYRKSYSSGEPPPTVSSGSLQEPPQPVLRSVSDSDYQCSSSKHLTASYPRRRSSGSSDQGGLKRIEFEVNDLFLFGCPLGIILVYRKLMSFEDKTCSIPRPACQQVYNLFHPTDPLAVRLEPLLSARFSLLPPITIPRYTKYPLGDGQPTHLLECIQSHGNVFSSSTNIGSPSMGCTRRLSDASIVSTVSGMGDTVPISTINAVSQRWWGIKRLDYALYCPEGLSNFPSNVLPHLFHASYWESYDVVAFIIRQLIRSSHPVANYDDKESCVFLNTQPREKWQKKRTSVKIKNIAANHRGNDIIVLDGAPQHIQARFMYGPLDMVALSGERVDVHVRRDPPAGDWQYLSTTLTDKSGRLALSVPQERRLSLGVYPIKMIVRGDHTTCTLHLAVVPLKTECVVFSIDGSFTASVSVTGKDPKVRAGAVDVVRHWQELGYLILYITGRPDMQQQKVVAWLAQHNFPHGLVSFADGLSTDPLGHKTDYLRNIIQDCEVVIEAAYGSAKDITVYSSLGLTPEQIYIVGKANKKQASSAQVLSDGYAAHLAHLSTLGSTRPARTHPNMSIPKGFFGLPGQTNALRRRSLDKTTKSLVSKNESILVEQLWSHIKLSRVVNKFKNHVK